jgi:hypothetical protein
MGSMQPLPKISDSINQIPWRVKMRPEPIIAQSVNSDKSTISRSQTQGPALKIYKGFLTPEGEAQTFYESLVDGDGDCGFTVLGIAREELADTLEALSEKPAARDFLCEEIYEIFRTNGLPSPDGWEQLRDDYDDSVGRYNAFIGPVLKRICPENTPEIGSPEANILLESLRASGEVILLGLAEERHREVVQKEQGIKDFCKQQEIFSYYVQSYRETPLWLGYKSALLYAKSKNISLYVWKCSEISGQVKLMGSQASNDPSAPKPVHMLMTSSYTHYNRLETEEDFVQRQLQLKHDDDYEKIVLQKEELVKSKISEFFVNEFLILKNKDEKSPEAIQFFDLIYAMLFFGKKDSAKNSAALSRELEEKRKELNKKNLEIFRAETMLEPVLYDQSPQGNSRDQDTTSFLLPATIRKEYVDHNRWNLEEPEPKGFRDKLQLDNLIARIGTFFGPNSPLFSEKKEVLIRNILSGNYGDKFEWAFNGENNSYHFFREEHSGESALLIEDKANPFSEDSIVFCSEREFHLSESNHALSRSDDGTGVRLLSAPRHKIVHALNGKDKGRGLIGTKALGKGIFEYLTHFEYLQDASGKSMKSLQDEMIKKLFRGNQSIVSHVLMVFSRLRELLKLSDFELIKKLGELSNDQELRFGLNIYFAERSPTGEMNGDAFFKNISLIGRVNEGNRSLLQMIRDFFYEKGIQLCSERAVCERYFDAFMEDPDQWLCQVEFANLKAGTWNASSIATKLSSVPPDWFRLSPLNREEIVKVIKSMLESQALPEETKVHAENFVQDINAIVTLEILRCYAESCHMKNITEFSVVDFFVPPGNHCSPKTGRLKIKANYDISHGNKHGISVIFFRDAYHLLTPMINQLVTFVGNFLSEARQATEKFLLSYFVSPKSPPINNNYHQHIMNKFAEAEVALQRKKDIEVKKENKIVSAIKLLSEDIDFVARQAERREERLTRFERFLLQNTVQSLKQKLLEPLALELFGTRPVNELQLITLGRVLSKLGTNISEIQDEYHNNLFALAIQHEFSPDILRGFFYENASDNLLEGVFGQSIAFSNSRALIIAPQDKKDGTLLRALHESAVKDRGVKGSQNISKYKISLEHAVNNLRALLRDRRLYDGSILFEKLSELTLGFLDDLSQYEKDLITDLEKDPPKLLGKLIDRLENRSEIFVEILHCLFHFIITSDYNWLNKIEQLYEKAESVFFQKAKSRLLNRTKKFIGALKEVLKQFPNLALTYEDSLHQLKLKEKGKELLNEQMEVRRLNQSLKQKEAEILEHKNTISALNAESKKKDAVIKTKDEALNSMTKQFNDKKSELEEREAAMNQEKVLINQDHDRITKALTEKNEILTKENTELKAALDLRNREINTLGRQLDDINKELGQKQIVVDERALMIQAQDAKIGEKKEVIKGLKKELDGVKAKLRERELRDEIKEELIGKKKKEKKKEKKRGKIKASQANTEVAGPPAAEASASRYSSPGPGLFKPTQVNLIAEEQNQDLASEKKAEFSHGSSGGI